MIQRRKPAVVFIFITLVLDVLGIGLIIPILPKLVEQLHGGTPAESAFTYGWLLGIYALMQFVFSPILGSLSDRIGRRKVILVSLFGAGLDYFLMAWAPTLLWFFVARIISGITGANFSAATAYIADISPPEKRASNFGVVGAAFGLGFAIGPAIGGWIGAIDLRLPFIIGGCLTLLNWLYGYFVLPESLKEENRREFSWRRANPLGALLNLRRYPLVLSLAATYFLFGLGHQVYPAIWVLFTGRYFGWGPQEVGNSLALVGIMAAIVQGGLARIIIPKLRERKSAIVGTLINIAAMIGFGLATSEWMIYAIIVVGALGDIATPAIQGLVSRSVRDDEQGEVNGALTSLQSVAAAIGPLVMAAIYGFFISGKASVEIPGAAFFFAGFLTLVALLLMVISFRRLKPE